MRVNNRLVLCLMVMSVTARAVAGAPASPPIVQTESGKVRGVLHDGVSAFKGIPYAVPPVGDRRWKPPSPAAPWTGVRDATHFGNDCMQTRRDWDVGRANAPISEDCLTLNIWAPAKKRSGHAAVMVWIHGGAFTAGSSAQPVYDGEELAHHDVVVVTFNYRLGRFGFFAHPALTREAAGAPTGNYGIMDQLAVLEWVKRNIAAFGGDPANVTIFGQSAGGGSVNQLMLAPSARGLFHKAIAQSGGGRDRGLSRTDAEAKGIAFAAKAGAASDDPAALRAIPAQAVLGKMTLLDPESATYSGPFVDGQIITGDVDTLFATGRQATIAYMAGTTSDEIAFLPAPVRKLSSAIAAAGLGADLAEIRASYPTPEAFDQHVMSDAIFVEPARFLAQTTAPNTSYLYSFEYVPEAKRANQNGAPHAAELPYLFGNLETLDVAATAADMRIASAMGGYWTNFAKTGNPNGKGLPPWPRFKLKEGALMAFGAEGPAARSASTPSLDALARHAARNNSAKRP